jgi:hypothetical protein
MPARRLLILLMCSSNVEKHVAAKAEGLCHISERTALLWKHYVEVSSHRDELIL